MSFLKRLFSSPDVVQKTVDGVFSGVDKSFFTDEERADMTLKAQAVYEKLWMASVPSALSRRIIACSVVLMWMVMIFSMLVAKAIGANAFADFAIQIMGEIVLQPFNIIVSFYFLSHVVKTFNKQ